MKIYNVSNPFTPNNQFIPNNQFTPQYPGDPFDLSFKKSNITWCSNSMAELVCVFVGYLTYIKQLGSINQSYNI